MQKIDDKIWILQNYIYFIFIRLFKPILRIWNVYIILMYLLLILFRQDCYNL